MTTERSTTAEQTHAECQKLKDEAIRLARRRREAAEVILEERRRLLANAEDELRNALIGERAARLLHVPDLPA